MSHNNSNKSYFQRTKANTEAKVVYGRGANRSQNQSNYQGNNPNQQNKPPTGQSKPIHQRQSTNYHQTNRNETRFTRKPSYEQNLCKNYNKMIDFTIAENQELRSFDLDYNILLAQYDDSKVDCTKHVWDI